MSDYEEMLGGLKGIAHQFQAVNDQAMAAYTPIVDEIACTRSRDINHIEHTLDGLLGFCCYEPALALFKKLCRYYWDIDPTATAEHIDFYREMWDSDDAEPDTDEAGTTDGDDA